MARRAVLTESENHDRWTISYADLITLLFAFFVVMYSISVVDNEKRRLVSDSIVTAFGGTVRSVPTSAGGDAGADDGEQDEGPVEEDDTPGAVLLQPINVTTMEDPGPFPLEDGAPGSFEAADASPAPASPGATSAGGGAADKDTDTGTAQPGTASSSESTLAQAEAASDAGTDKTGPTGTESDEQTEPKMLQAADLEEVAGEIRESLKELVEQGAVEITQHDDRMEIEIRSSVLFASGSAELSREAQAILEKVGRRILPMKNSIRVEGFTDNLPMKSAFFPSNWELAAMRAAGVTRRLEELGLSAGRLYSVGYGEQNPIADNGTAAGRAMNRRVVVVVLIEPPEVTGGNR